jgi:hypothetical protein
MAPVATLVFIQVTVSRALLPCSAVHWRLDREVLWRRTTGSKRKNFENFNFNSQKKELFDRMRLQEEAMEAKKHWNPRSVEDKLSVITRRLVDEAVLTKKSQDNVSLTIVVFLPRQQQQKPGDAKVGDKRSRESDAELTQGNKQPECKVRRIE